MSRAVLQWSGGKDSALALARIREESSLTVAELQTMYDPERRRTSWHGVREDVLNAQADALDLPLTLVPVDDTVEAYVDRMEEVFADYRECGVEYLAVGDVEEDDPDTPRETAMEGAGLAPFYPLLGEDPGDLVRAFLDAGFRATVVVVDGSVLDESFAGREVDESFLADLPAAVDDGGERGEYHTIATDGPVFEEPLAIETGDVETRTIRGDPFHYCDVTLA